VMQLEGGAVCSHCNGQCEAMTGNKYFLHDDDEINTGDGVGVRRLEAVGGSVVFPLPLK
jgi:hypothetical protein